MMSRHEMVVMACNGGDILLQQMQSNRNYDGLNASHSWYEAIPNVFCFISFNVGNFCPCFAGCPAECILCGRWHDGEQSYWQQKSSGAKVESSRCPNLGHFAALNDLRVAASTWSISKSQLWYGHRIAWDGGQTFPTETKHLRHDDVS